jgi:transposase
MSTQPQVFVGIDISDKTSVVVTIDSAGVKVRQVQISNTARSLQTNFQNRPPMRIGLEVGAQSMWMARTLRSFGHEVYVANARELRLISGNSQKSDANDALLLARLVRVDPALLHPVRHRAEDAHCELLVVRSRRALVEARTSLVNAARGLVKPFGIRIPKCSTKVFEDRAFETLPATMRGHLLPLLEQIGELSAAIGEYDRKIEGLAEAIPAVRRMRTIPGVGALTAFAFFYTIDDPERFRSPRDVGPFLGLTPRRNQSGTRDPKLGITKAGDPYLRALLGQCAHRLLGPLKTSRCALRDFGHRKAGEGEGGQPKRALVAVTRKLAVLMLRLWRSDTDFVAYPQGAPMTE